MRAEVAGRGNEWLAQLHVFVMLIAVPPSNTTGVVRMETVTGSTSHGFPSTVANEELERSADQFGKCKRTPASTPSPGSSNARKIFSITRAILSLPFCSAMVGYSVLSAFSSKA